MLFYLRDSLTPSDYEHEEVMQSTLQCRSVPCNVLSAGHLASEPYHDRRINTLQFSQFPGIFLVVILYTHTHTHTHTHTKNDWWTKNSFWHWLGCSVVWSSIVYNKMLQVQSLVRVCTGGNRSMFLTLMLLSLSLFSPASSLSKSINISLSEV